VFGKKPFKSVGKPSDACMNVIEENIRFGRDRGINSTPTIVLGDGRVVTGYKGAAELSALIKK
jgi:protein-disulfide isomerase